MSKPLQLHAGDGKIAMNELGHVLLAYGTTVPSDGADGYSPGAIFLHVDGGTNTLIYVNAGSVTSCDFNALANAGVAPGAALTAADASTIDTTFGQQEADVLSNLRTRVGEIEARLEAAGIVAAN